MFQILCQPGLRGETVKFSCQTWTGPRWICGTGPERDSWNVMRMLGTHAWRICGTVARFIGGTCRAQLPLKRLLHCSIPDQVAQLCLAAADVQLLAHTCPHQAQEDARIQSLCHYQPFEAPIVQHSLCSCLAHFPSSALVSWASTLRPLWLLWRESRFGAFDYFSLGLVSGKLSFS